MILGVVTLEVVGLVILYSLSIRNNGIVPVEERYHSLWKYGPTAGASNPRTGEPSVSWC